MNWEVRVAKSARKNLARFSNKDRERLLFALSEFSLNPYASDIEDRRRTKRLASADRQL